MSDNSKDNNLNVDNESEGTFKLQPPIYEVIPRNYFLADDLPPNRITIVCNDIVLKHKSTSLEINLPEDYFEDIDSIEINGIVFSKIKSCEDIMSSQSSTSEQRKSEISRSDPPYEDELLITFDNYEVPTLLISRLMSGKISILKHLFGQKAKEIYEILTKKENDDNETII